jgi:hypothetical protein
MDAAYQTIMLCRNVRSMRRVMECYGVLSTVSDMLIVVTSAAAARTALLADLSGRPYRSYNRRFSID